MPKIDLAQAVTRTGSIYPPPYAATVAGRSYIRLGDSGGITQFGANIAIIAPGGQSSLLHTHSHEDEFVIVLSGRLVLETQAGETEMGPGDCAAFPAGGGEFHHFVNRTAEEARFLVIGTRQPDDTVIYPEEIDLRMEKRDGVNRVLHRDGTPWDKD